MELHEYRTIVEKLLQLYAARCTRDVDGTMVRSVVLSCATTMRTLLNVRPELDELFDTQLDNALCAIWNRAKPPGKVFLSKPDEQQERALMFLAPSLKDFGVK